jgi:hypothetical protein
MSLRRTNVQWVALDFEQTRLPVASGRWKERALALAPLPKPGAPHLPLATGKRVCSKARPGPPTQSLDVTTLFSASGVTL